MDPAPRRRCASAAPAETLDRFGASIGGACGCGPAAQTMRSRDIEGVKELIAPRVGPEAVRLLAELIPHVHVLRDPPGPSRTAAASSCRPSDSGERLMRAVLAVGQA